MVAAKLANLDHGVRADTQICESVTQPQAAELLQKDSSPSGGNESPRKRGGERKDLTQFERSKNLVALAETAAKVLSDLSSAVDDKSKRGRPEKKASEDRIAERVGVPRPTIHNAKAHVAAVTNYPELAAPGIPPQPRHLTPHSAGQAASAPDKAMPVQTLRRVTGQI
jgi:hypothetical protein